MARYQHILPISNSTMAPRQLYNCHSASEVAPYSIICIYIYIICILLPQMNLFMKTVFHLTDTDECASNPCQNGATCNDAVNQYTCTCVAGWQDAECQSGEYGLTHWVEINGHFAHGILEYPLDTGNHPILWQMSLKFLLKCPIDSKHRFC